MAENRIKDTFFSKNRSVNCRGKLLNLASPRIMGILNITTDSFYDGGRYSDPEAALHRFGEMLNDGADIIDIGAASSRPGAELVSPDEELQRLGPVLERIRPAYPDAIISIDTYNSKVAAEMADHFQVDIINDISAGELDPEMFPTVAKLNIPYIMMHMKGTPGNMQEDPTYNNLMDEVIRYFSDKIHRLRDLGISDVMIDPGFGFGKTLDHNYQLISQLETLQMFEIPVVAGISRKSMIYKLLDTDPENSLNGTTAAHMVLLQKGINILRVHDVRQAKEAIKIYEKSYLT